MTVGSGGGWVPLGTQTWWTPLILINPAIAVILVFPAVNVADNLARGLPLGLRISINVAVFVAAFAGTIAIGRLVYRRPSVNPTLGAIRAGRRQATFTQLTSAKLVTGSSKSRLPFMLVVRSDSGLRAAIPVRDGRHGTLDPEAAAIVQDMIRESSIAMPVSPDDPTGRFARFNFPENVTLEEALELVTHPPESPDDLPTTSWHGTGRGTSSP